MLRISRILAREVFDSRGRPTVEVEAACHGARPARAIVPSGASTGRFEAVELRDGGARLDGRGVSRAVEHVGGEIARALAGCDAGDQQEIDRRLCELDGTPDKSRLGANAILGASLAVAYAAAEARGVLPVEHFHEIWRRVPASGRGSEESAAPEAGAGRSATDRLGQSLLLPLPMVNMISGGLHAGGQLDFQDFLVIPVGASSFRQALEWAIAIYGRLGEVLTRAGYEGGLVGDEGGYGPRLERNEQALEMIVAAIDAAGLVPGTQAAIGLDVAATHFAHEGGYRLTSEGGRPLTGGEGTGTGALAGATIASRQHSGREPGPSPSQRLTADELIDRLAEWTDRFPIASIEDALAEDDWHGWTRLTARLGGRVQLIGDDLFVTQAARLQRGIDAHVANAVLVKLNQVGTLWETLETLRLALDAGYRPVISARSGETEDTTIADLAVATGCGQIKIGSVARSERLAKYNQLLRLEERLGDRAGWLGGGVFDFLARM
ncbi:MAG TPA: phosphopyruvate hydratase [Planctomycetaceae bacterium]|nr:phosphopyruvate hydratase [Planctomycetaceae bacterium]